MPEDRYALCMRRVEASVLVASPDRVFAFYDDIAGTPDWVPFVTEIVSVTPGRTVSAPSIASAPGCC